MQDSISSHFLLAPLITGLSLILSILLINIGARDIPNARSSHQRAVSRNGGVAIVIAFYGGILSLCMIGKITLAPLWFTSFVLGAAMAILGLADDLFVLPYKIRIIVQVLVASFLVTRGLQLQTVIVPMVGYLDLGVLGCLVSVLWLVGVMNAYNFMDGLNGLAPGGALILSLGLGFLGVPPFLSFCLFFAILGFLALNFPYGKIFMGDAGSLFLGFMFGVLTLYLMTGTSPSVGFSVGPILLFAFLWDTILTVVRRWRRGEHIFIAHREHLYQLLNRAGWSHVQVTMLHLIFMCIQLYVAYVVMRDMLAPLIGLGILGLIQTIYTYGVFKRAQKAGVPF